MKTFWRNETNPHIIASEYRFLKPLPELESAAIVPRMFCRTRRLSAGGPPPAGPARQGKAAQYDGKYTAQAVRAQPPNRL